jgi:hypothetical protein
MSDELTRRLSGPVARLSGPVAERRAKGGVRDLVHLVVAGPGNLVDPSVLRTRCGRRALEVYSDGRAVTRRSVSWRKRHGGQPPGD